MILRNYPLATAGPVQRVHRLDLVASTVALVFQPPLQPPVPFSGQDMARFLHLPTPGYSADGSLAINSHRDQIEVLLSANKLDVRNVSGEFEKGVDRVPAVMHGMCEVLSAPAPKSFGVNFLLSVDKQDPRVWMAQTFLKEDLASVMQDSLGSDIVSVIYGRGKKIITVRFEVRPDSGITVNYNASEEVGELPGREQLAADIEVQEGNLRELLGALGI